jgi:hypothetical protein
MSVLFLLCIGTGVLLLLRIRLGVVLFFVTYLTILILGAKPHQNTSGSQPQQTGALLYTAITGWYLAKRWHLYNNPTADDVIAVLTKKRGPRFDTVTGEQNW